MLTNNYKIEVPAELRIYKTPDDFNHFVNKIYPNLLMSVKSRVFGNKDVQQSVVNGFIIYMLECGESGKVRYRQYDRAKYPNIPYYKWFFMKLTYYILKNFRKTIEDSSITESLKGLSTYLYVNHGERPDSIFDLREIELYLENYSRKSTTLFGKNTHVLYIFKMEGYSNVDMALLLDVDKSTISLWMNKLQGLLKNYINLDKYVLK